MTIDEEVTAARNPWNTEGLIVVPGIDVAQPAELSPAEALLVGMLPIGGEVGLEALARGRGYAMSENFVAQNALICENLSEESPADSQQSAALGDKRSPRGDSAQYQWGAILWSGRCCRSSNSPSSRNTHRENRSQ